MIYFSRSDNLCWYFISIAKDSVNSIAASRGQELVLTHHGFAILLQYRGNQTPCKPAVGRLSRANS